MRLTSSNLAYEYVRSKFDTFQEKVFLVGVTSKNTVRFCKMVSCGGHDWSSIDNRVLFRELLLGDCVRFFLFHNHPSGDVQPSENDNNATKKLKEQCEFMGFEFLDHIIFSDMFFYSYFDNDNL